ncbi:MAG TPA: glycosyltransferase family 1 protein, partial [Roseiflexaceae bacterium]|nr:glycosyltransferase family 1 protein [Roseiflexaceae bacterium]
NTQKHGSAAATNRPTIGIDGRFLQDKFHGIGRYLYGLLAGLCALPGQHRVVLFVDPSLPNQRFPLDRLVASGRLELHPIAFPLYSPRELWSWPRVLRATPVDLFHSPYIWSPILLPCPLVTTFHDMIFDHYPEYIPGRRCLIPYKVMSRLALIKSRRVIAVSQATRDDIVEFAGFGANKIATILSGVEPAFKPVSDAAERARVRSRYGLPESYILALGARRPHKNIRRLVAAFERVAATIPQTLILVGDVDPRFSDDATPAIARLKARGRLREIGHVAEQDLPALYSMADVFVQPSIIEGFGLPVLEAMACGCPVACSNTSSLPEVAHDAALLFDPLSEDQIA